MLLEFFSPGTLKCHKQCQRLYLCHLKIPQAMSATVSVPVWNSSGWSGKAWSQTQFTNISIVEELGTACRPKTRDSTPLGFGHWCTMGVQSKTGSLPLNKQCRQHGETSERWGRVHVSFAKHPDIYRLELNWTVHLDVELDGFVRCVLCSHGAQQTPGFGTHTISLTRTPI